MAKAPDGITDTAAAMTTGRAHLARLVEHAARHSSVRANPEIEEDLQFVAAVLWAESAQEELLAGAALILRDRARQLSCEWLTAAHDDQLQDGSLLHAAIIYAAAALDPEEAQELGTPTGWPLHAIAWRPASGIRMLIKAGALLAAEIDRRQRAGEAFPEAPTASDSTATLGAPPPEADAPGETISNALRYLAAYVERDAADPSENLAQMNAAWYAQVLRLFAQGGFHDLAPPLPQLTAETT